METITKMSVRKVGEKDSMEDNSQELAAAYVIGIPARNMTKQLREFGNAQFSVSFERSIIYFVQDFASNELSKHCHN